MTRDQMGFQFEKEEDFADESVENNTPHIHTVSEINNLIRRALEGGFQQIWLRAEISNFKAHTSGHFYFSLKDQDSQINAVMFRGLNSKLKFKPDNGLEVLVRGKISVYEPRGTYQIFCEHMEPVGAGALQKAFEQLKAKLQAEGLFEQKRKRQIPAFPLHIGLVTSPTGAAIQDILNVLRRRYKSARITLSPCLVQGEPAPTSIVAALELINKLKDLDVIIIGRGGGSIEDLWAFNDERVARAIAASRVPTISAVGHEIDFTIADFVADMRAPTPSAAAELVAKSAVEVLEGITHLQQRLANALRVQFRTWQERVSGLAKRLQDPQRKLQDLQIRCDELALRLESAMSRFIEERRMTVRLALQKMGTPRELILKLQKRVQMAESQLQARTVKLQLLLRAKIENAVGRLDAMSPLRVVARGYSILERGQGSARQIVTSYKQVKAGDQLRARLAEGELNLEVKEMRT